MLKRREKKSLLKFKLNFLVFLFFISQGVKYNDVPGLTHKKEKYLVLKLTGPL